MIRSSWLITLAGSVRLLWPAPPPLPRVRRVRALPPARPCPTCGAPVRGRGRWYCSPSCRPPRRSSWTDEGYPDPNLWIETTQAPWGARRQ